jgi:Uma2 family endonuclease
VEARETRLRWTYAEFARLPSEGGARHEVIDGELVMTPAPGRRHQRVVTDLVRILGSFVHDNDLGELFAGPFDVLFAEGDYLEPDIVFVRKDRTHLLSDRGVEGPPDLVVEVASPSTVGRDRGVKLDRYRHYGVAEYWIVDLDASAIEVWHLAAGASEVVVLGESDTLVWAPSEGASALEVSVRSVFPTPRP